MKGLALVYAVSVLSLTAVGQVLQWGIEKRHTNNAVRRRATSTLNTIVNNEASQGGYFVSVTIGSSKQKLALQLDTGSSDIWVPYSGAQACQQTQRSNGCADGSYNPDDSDTFQDLGQNTFQIQYVDNSGAEGDYFTDDFNIGGQTIRNLTMGLALKTDIAFGLVGVGYALNEASAETVESLYPNLPLALQEDGIIKTVAYSLWLNDLDASKGSILFGGIDTEKYAGNLVELDIVPDAQIHNYTHFQVHMTSLVAMSSSGSDTLTSTEYPFIVVLDSGTTLTYLPQDLAEAAWNEVGAQWIEELGFAALPCSYANNKGQFTFGLGGSGGPRINVTMDELVIDLTGGNAPEYPSGKYEGELVCAFGIQNDSSSASATYLLGDSFLRSAYVVYDLVNNKVALAPTKFNATDSNVVAFASKGAPIPSATKAPGADATASSTSSSQTASDDSSAASGFQDGADSDKSESAAFSMRSLTWTSVSLVLGAVLYMI